MLHIVLDANAIGVDPPLGKLGHRVLLDAHRDGTIVLVVPRLALQEAINGWKREIRAQSSRLVTAQQKMEQLHPAYSLHLPALDRDSAADQLLAAHIARLEAAGVKLPSTPDVSHDELIQRALDRRQPFDEKGSGYRDALLWHIVRDLAGEGHDVVLISDDRAAFADGRQPGAALAESLITELHGVTGRLFAHVHEAIENLGLVAHDAVEAARTIIESGKPMFAEMLRTQLLEELSHRVHRSSTREIVNPFIAAGASLGLAHDALDARVLEARRTEHDRLEASVALEVRQFVTIFVPIVVMEQIAHLGRPFVSDDDVGGVEIDAKVRHLCQVVLDPVTDQVLQAEVLEVLGVEPEIIRGYPVT